MTAGPAGRSLAATEPASDRLRDLRVLVVHDWLVTWAGAERVLAAILEIVPHADLVVAVRTERMAREHPIARRAKETWVGRVPMARTRHRWFVPLHYAAFSALDTSGYDLVISSSHAFAKAVRPSGSAPHVCYCHSPPRYLWDMGAAYRETSRAFAATALRASTPALRLLDRRSARGVTQFVSNSEFVARRIRHAYGRSSIVVHPPVQAKAAGRRPREDFLLSVGRLVAYKRIDLAIRAAELLGVRLLVAGAGRERRRLERIAGPHTTFLGEVDEGMAGDLMERCRAFLFCAEEDFGIAPVEANAHGAPVVGYAKGGLLESMREEETAVFFPRQTVEDVAAAIERAMALSWDSDAIRRNAARFSAARFREDFESVLLRALSAASPSARR